MMNLVGDEMTQLIEKKKDWSFDEENEVGIVNCYIDKRKR
jgi:hypothetical protein